MEIGTRWLSLSRPRSSLLHADPTSTWSLLHTTMREQATRSARLRVNNRQVDGLGGRRRRLSRVRPMTAADVPAHVLRPPEVRHDDQPLRDLRHQPRRQPRPADGRWPSRSGWRSRSRSRSTPTRRGPGRSSRSRPAQVMDLNAGYDITDEQGAADRLLPQGLRRQPAALDVPRRGPGLRRHRAGAQPARRDRCAASRDIPFLPIHFDFLDPEGQPC